MTKSKFKRKKEQKGWLYAIFWILIIILIGYIFFSAGEQKKVEQHEKLDDNKQKLEAKKKAVLTKIHDLENQISELVKKRTQELIVARILLVTGIISLNFVYYLCIVPNSEKHGYMINHFSDFTSFTILLYSAIAFLFTGSMKVFSEKINNALFQKVFFEEENLKLKKENHELYLSEIEIKLKALNTI